MAVFLFSLATAAASPHFFAPSFRSPLDLQSLKTYNNRCGAEGDSAHRQSPLARHQLVSLGSHRDMAAYKQGPDYMREDSSIPMMLTFAEALRVNMLIFPVDR